MSDIDRRRVGFPTDRMNSASRTARERAMMKFASDRNHVAHWLRQKIDGPFNLESVARALDVSEQVAWGVAIENRPTRTFERRRLEDAYGLPRLSPRAFIITLLVAIRPEWVKKHDPAAIPPSPDGALRDPNTR